MVKEVINSIIEAENKAEGIINKAYSSSKKLTSDTAVKSDDIIHSAEKEAKEIIKNASSLASNEAKEEYDKIILEGKKESEELKAKAKKHFKEAVELVKRSI